MIGKENNMKKILSLVLALGMIFSLAACSGGGESGGRIVATGTPEEIAANAASATGRFL